MRSQQDGYMEPQEGHKRWLHGWQNAGWLALMLLPGLLTVYLGFRSGGYFVGVTSLAAAEMALLVGLRFALSKRPLQGVGAPLVVAAVAMGGFCAWTLLSGDWSDSMARAYPAYSRALLCGLVLVFFGLLPFDIRRIRWMIYGVAAAIVVICAAALTARLLPNIVFDPELVREARLGYPLTYWNALGIIGCIGTVLCAHLACSTRDAPAARVLGAASVPLLVLTLYYTLSRGGIWAVPIAVVVYCVLGRPRGLLSGAIATVPPTVVALFVASPSSAVTEGYPHAMISSGEHVALILGGCILAAALLRTCLLPLDNWLTHLRLPERSRQPVLIGAVAVGLILVLAAGTAADVPDVVNEKYHEFTDRQNTDPESRGDSRLLSARSQGRFELWDVALDGYRANRLHGTGAGTYALLWERDRAGDETVQNAHSLYVEVLGELGLVGLILLLTVIAMILGAFAYRARGPDRAMFAALLAAGLAWAVHAGVDWDWQMPAVTVWLFALGGATLARSLRRRRRSPNAELKNVILRAGGVVACLLLAIFPARVALSQARLDAAIDAFYVGDCGKARDDALGSLSAVGQRPTPYAVIAYCDMGEDRYGRAVSAMRQAVRRDAGNWEFHYSLALARAGAGLNPRPQALKAAQLNPNDPIARSAPVRLRGGSPAEWQAAAREAYMVPPAPGDP